MTFLLNRYEEVYKALPVLCIFLFFSCSGVKQGQDFTRNYSHNGSNSVVEDAPFLNKSRTKNTAVQGRAVKDRKNQTDLAVVSREREVKKRKEEKAGKPDRLPEISAPNTPDGRHISGLRSSVLQTARRQLGIPYQYGGSTRTAFDCSGLTQYCYRKQGISIARSSRQQSVQGKRKTIGEAKPGDLIFFGQRGKVSHVGIVSTQSNESLRVIHASSSKGVVEEDVLQSTYWRSRILYIKDCISDRDDLALADESITREIR